MPPDRILLPLLGALAGLALWPVAEHWPEGETPAFRLALSSFVCAFSLVLHFAWTRAQARRLLALSLGVGLVYGAISFWVGWQLPRPGEPFQGDGARSVTWVLGAGLSLFALGPFLQGYLRSGTLRVPYRELFAGAWSNAGAAAVGGLLLGALWTVLGLWAALFGLVKITLFSNLFAKPVFAWSVSGAALAAGVRIGRENARVIEALRHVSLLAHHLLLSLVSFVAVLFLVTLAFTGLGPLWEQEYASGLVLGWLALHGLFLNAALQDGSEPPPAARALRVLAKAGVLTLPVFGAIAVYGLGLRIAQHGLTPTRFWGMWIALVALGAGLGYAASLRPRSPGWLPTVPAVNRALAWIVVALALATHTPLLDPLAWSARDQVRRLLSGRVAPDAFDYGFLHFRLGRAGDRALAELERIALRDGLDAVRDGAFRARTASSHDEWTNAHLALRTEDVFVRPEDAPIPPALLDAIRRESSHEWGRCRSNHACSAAAVELDGHPGAEWLVAFGDAHARVLVFVQSSGAWSRGGHLVSSDEPAGQPSSSLREGRFEAAAPLWRDVLIAGQRYRLHHSR
jgi:hypothetical protein